jgi:hypothetical protein
MCTVKNVYIKEVSLNVMKGSEKGERPYKTMNVKAVLQPPEENNRWK